jgi:hypothetical protein
MPAKLINILVDKHADPDAIGWISSFMTNRQQYVTYQSETSRIIRASVGTPQGSVISPYLFCLYVSGIHSEAHSTKIIKYADDLVICGMCDKNGLGEEQYRDTITSCIETFNQLNLVLNKSKTKEMVVSFSKSKPQVPPLTVDGTVIEQTASFKYLGTVLTDDFDFNPNWEARVSKARQRLYLLKKLVYSNADRTIMRMTYNSFIKPVLTYHLDIFHNHLHQTVITKINSIQKAASRISNCKMPPVIDEENRKALCLKLYLQSDHPFQASCTHMPSGRLRQPLCRTARCKKSFRIFFYQNSQ